MLRPARILLGIVAVILLVLGFRMMLFPDAASAILGLTAENDFGGSNLRAMAAPMLMLGILGGISAAKSSFSFGVALPLYFLMLIVTRIVTLVADGSSPGVIKALVFAVVFFAITEFSVQVFKKAAKQDSTTA
ncbi:MAG: hypothetical protein ACU0C9_04500 [Paracoccaceae bacterium]